MRFISGVFYALTSSLLYGLGITILPLYLLIIIIIWLVMPIRSWRNRLKNNMFHIPSAWSESIRFTMWLTGNIKWDVIGTENLSKDQSYLLIANHQSHLDILVLQKVLDRKIPQLRYFMKKQLLWVPLLGQACWLLGYPFMQRHSKSYLKKHPEKRNQDLMATKKACNRFKGTPITLINYLEGTRFSKNKKQRQKSPYKHLLLPKAGGTAFTMESMGDQINTVLNVTIVYSANKHFGWTFLKGQMKKITVRVEKIDIPAELRGDYQNDREFRVRFQKWINQIWQEKDQLISTLHNNIANQ